MKIFNLIITTEAKQKDRITSALAYGWDRGKNFAELNDVAIVNEVIHSLKELKHNTWDIERVEQAIKWLQDSFILKNRINDDK